ncbi:hypothetical protein [Stenotrophomonas sp.]|uniref:hypothetical protein n=1 Tax=Stenotrophomonas sp. TaxID=69392 RepID=UPI0028AF3BA4|nr:hypothetical protein [Stenotrophomonas sp.]
MAKTFEVWHPKHRTNHFISTKALLAVQILLHAGQRLEVKLLPTRLTKVPASQLTALRALAAITLYFMLIHMAEFPIVRHNTQLLPAALVLSIFSIYCLLQQQSPTNSPA